MVKRNREKEEERIIKACTHIHTHTHTPTQTHSVRTSTSRSCSSPDETDSASSRSHRGGLSSTCVVLVVVWVGGEYVLVASKGAVVILPLSPPFPYKESIKSFSPSYFVSSNPLLHLSPFSSRERYTPSDAQRLREVLSGFTPPSFHPSSASPSSHERTFLLVLARARVVRPRAVLLLLLTLLLLLAAALALGMVVVVVVVVVRRLVWACG